MPASATPRRVRKHELLQSLPLEWPDTLLPTIQAEVARSQEKVVVLDDDPTGTQTVHGVPVLTQWPEEALQAELRSSSPAFYLLTNSRSFPLQKAKAINREIGRNLARAAEAADAGFVVVSRSDSTLRGHFPGEVQALAEAIGESFDAWLVVPFFLEGGRYTVHDVHYVAEEGWLTPAGETEFAEDKAFGYEASDLKAWVQEKTGGAVLADSVASISIEELRVGGPDRVEARLRTLEAGGVCVVNAASMRDMEVFVLGLLRAEADGLRFLYRTAASIVPVRAGIPPRPLLEVAEMPLASGHGGLFVVGSHVPRTTSQVEALLKETDIVSLELHVEALLDEARRAGEIGRVVEQAESGLRRGDDVVVYTSRELIHGEDAESSLQIGQSVSRGLVNVVKSIGIQPRYLLAKGGITSSDVATDGLGVQRAMVLGQIVPGVPVWRLGEESSWPDLTYIVFPGNVGDETALVEIARALRESRKGSKDVHTD